MRRTIVVLLGCVAVLMAPASALAGRSDSVDPTGMQPGLNPAFAPWECWRNATGIRCEGHVRDAWTNVEWGLVCDGRPVFTTGTQNVDSVRHGDDNGLALWTQSNAQIQETLSLQPDGSGPTLRAVMQEAEHFDYSTPGDVSTRSEKDTGVYMRITGAGVGLVLGDVGVQLFDLDDNWLAPGHGHHPIHADVDAAFARVCDAFQALGA
jgi:hypothetical protein